MSRHSVDMDLFTRVLVMLGVFLPALLVPAKLAANEDEGQRLYRAACTQCHGLAPIEVTTNGREGWKRTVQKMVVTGAQLDVDEMELVIDYLVREHGPGSSTHMTSGELPPDSPMAKSGKLELPAGEGAALVQGYCVMCHDLGRVVATRRKESEWRGYTIDMLKRNNISVSEEQLNTMVSYLSRHLGK